RPAAQDRRGNRRLIGDVEVGAGEGERRLAVPLEAGNQVPAEHPPGAGHQPPVDRARRPAGPFLTVHRVTAHRRRARDEWPASAVPTSYGSARTSGRYRPGPGLTVIG